MCTNPQFPKTSFFVQCDLEQCKTYLTKPVDERSKYLSTNKLCYGCLIPIPKNHTARKCNQHQICTVCNNKHPMSLNGFKLQKKPNHWAVNDTPAQHGVSKDGVRKAMVQYVMKTSTKISAQVISMCVRPFVIEH